MHWLEELSGICGRKPGRLNPVSRADCRKSGNRCSGSGAMELPPLRGVTRDELRRCNESGYTSALMTSRFGKLVLALALAVMPLQGVAATLSVLLCHGEAQVPAAHAGDSHDHAAHADGQHDGHPADGSAAGGSVFHLCCHFTVSAPAAVTLAVALPDFPALAFAPTPLHDLFIPDRPQRPPLA